MTGEAFVAPATPVSRGRGGWVDYARLLKPRVMALAVFTAFAGLLAARAGGGATRDALAMICIAVGAGGAGALNMSFEANLDSLMRRTRARPVAAGRISRRDAAMFGAVLSVLSVAAMGWLVNALAAALLAFTIVFYAGVYTLGLKRRTPQNIVIGGLAGALPPAIGWAAAAGVAPLNAWLLVSIIFVWTPPHFWSMALCNSEDYARAGVPMMPVVKGAASTRQQILAYSVVLAALCVAPVFTGLGGPLYLAAAVTGGIGLIDLSIQLALSRAGDRGMDREPKPSTRAARDLFRFSIVFLFLLFAALVAERLAGLAPLNVGAL